MNTVTLAIETSTPQGSVAVFRGDDLVFTESFGSGRSHSSLLFASLERALSEVGSIDQIAVGLGPGSYAGVRIAISAAIGLSLASGAKLLGIPSIAALDDVDYVAVGDARRETFYFSLVRAGECIEGPELVPASELAAKLADPRLVDLPVFASEVLPAIDHTQLRTPCAERLARLAIAGKSIVSRDALEPIYLRDPHITVAKKKTREQMPRRVTRPE